MKNILSTVAMLALGITFTQCQDDLEKIPAQSGNDNYSLYIDKPLFNAAESRSTTHQDGTVEWNDNDQLLCYVFKTGEEISSNINDRALHAYRFNIDKTDSKNGRFVWDEEYRPDGNWNNLDKYIKPENHYDWYILYPFMEHSEATGVEYINITVPSIQTQDYANPTGHIGALDLLTGFAGNVSGEAKPYIQGIHHKTIMKITVVNKESTPVTLKSLRMEAENANITSNKNDFSFHIKGGTYILDENRDVNDYCTVKLENAKPLAANASYDFYMIIPQFTLTKGQWMTITIESDKGVFEQKKLMKKDMNFAAGCINTASIDASGFKPMANLTDIDSKFKAYMIDPKGGNADLNGDGEISTNEAQRVEQIYISNFPDYNITSVKGIEHFTEITSLSLSGETTNKGKLTTLDVSKNTKLKYLYCSNNALTSLTLGNHPELTTLQCENNSLSQINLSQVPKLEYLQIFNNKLTSLNVSNNTILWELTCDNNNLGTLDLKQNTKLGRLSCKNCGLTSLSTSTLNKLSDIDCSNNQLTTLDLSNSKMIYGINCSNNLLNSLTISKDELMLSDLMCSHNNLSSLDISNCSNIRTLHIDGNAKLKEVKVFEGFDATKMYELKSDEGVSFTMVADNSPKIVFEDINFKNYLVNYKNPGTQEADIDTNGDGEISEKEAARIMHPIMLDGKEIENITSIKGIEKFTNMQIFAINGPWNQEIHECPITTIDLTETNVSRMMINYTPKLSSIVLGKRMLDQFILITNVNTALKEIDMSQCTFSERSTIHISGYNGLEKIYVAPGVKSLPYLNGMFDGINPNIIVEKN